MLSCNGRIKVLQILIKFEPAYDFPFRNGRCDIYQAVLYRCKAMVTLDHCQLGEGVWTLHDDHHPDRHSKHHLQLDDSSVSILCELLLKLKCPDKINWPISFEFVRLTDLDRQNTFKTRSGYRSEKIFAIFFCRKCR